MGGGRDEGVSKERRYSRLLEKHVPEANPARQTGVLNRHWSRHLAFLKNMLVGYVWSSKNTSVRIVLHWTPIKTKYLFCPAPLTRARGVFYATRGIYRLGCTYTSILQQLAEQHSRCSY